MDAPLIGKVRLLASRSVCVKREAWCHAICRDMERPAGAFAALTGSGAAPPGGCAGKQRAPVGALEVWTSIRLAYALVTVDGGTEQKFRREVLFQPGSPRYAKP